MMLALNSADEGSSKWHEVPDISSHDEAWPSSLACLRCCKARHLEERSEWRSKAFGVDAL